MTSRLSVLFTLFQLTVFRLVYPASISYPKGAISHGVSRAQATPQGGASVHARPSQRAPGAGGLRHDNNQTSSSPPPEPWELQLAPLLEDEPSQRGVNTTLRGPPRLVGSYKGRWRRSRYGSRLQPADLLTAPDGMVVLHLSELEGEGQAQGEGRAQQGDGGGEGGSVGSSASSSSSSVSAQGTAGEMADGGGEGQFAVPGTVRYIEGELLLRNGAHVVNHTVRFLLRGTYVEAAGALHAVLEPIIPIEEDAERPPQPGGSRNATAVAGGGGGGGARELGEDDGSYREAVRTAAKYLLVYGPGIARRLVRQPPPSPPGPVLQRREAAAVQERTPASPPPPRPPLELALLKTCELRARFHVYYKGDPEARSHAQHLHLDRPASPSPSPADARRSNRGIPTTSSAPIPPGGDSDGLVRAAATAAAAGGSTSLRRLAADTEMYHSTQMQLHGGMATAAADADADVDIDTLLADVAGDVVGSSAGTGLDAVYGIPPGMDPNDPDLELVGTVLSTNCEFELYFNASSIHLERYYRQAVRYSVFVAAVTISQMVLTVLQAETSSTPSAAARMSLYCIMAQAILDSIQCLLHLAAALQINALLAAFVSTALLQFLLFAVFEMRQALLVWRGQRTNGTGASADEWTLRQDMSAVYTRFYTFLLGGLLAMFLFRSYLPQILLLLHSWWLPQVIHSAERDTRPPLRLEYVWGMSALRLLVPLYLYGCPRNLLRLEPQEGLCVALVVWVGLQAAVLTLQIRKGSRAFIPKAFLPQRYSYHRPATRREMGIEEPPPPQPPPPSSSASSTPSASASSVISGASQAPVAAAAAAAASFPIAALRRLTSALPSARAWLRRPSGALGGLVAAATGGGGGGDDAGGGLDLETGHGSKECVICMNPVPLLPLTTRMVTPCGHFFHDRCLTRWMEVKMDCPTCRRPLPPV